MDGAVVPIAPRRRESELVRATGRRLDGAACEARRAEGFHIVWHGAVSGPHPGHRAACGHSVHRPVDRLVALAAKKVVAHGDGHGVRSRPATPTDTTAVPVAGPATGTGCH